VNRTCWVVTDGRAALRNQCLGLAEAAGLTAAAKTVRSRLPWRRLPPFLWPSPFAAAGPGSDPLAPPWPDVVIAGGHAIAPLALAVRRASGGATFTVQVEDPGLDPARFDLVVPPAHDGLSGPNVVATRAAMHRITPDRLAEAAQQWGHRFAHLPRPLVAVLVGGPNRRYRMTDRVVEGLVDGLVRVAGAGLGIVLTASRRTPPAAVARLRERLAGRAEIWDGTGENPYLGYLALADHLVVSGDSVQMVSEAAATGRPVHVVALEGAGGKFDRFHRTLAEAGVTRPFVPAPDGSLATWTYAPLDDTARVARLLMERLDSRRLRSGG
jgi:mitochondrial fission protein ELM1